MQVVVWREADKEEEEIKRKHFKKCILKFHVMKLYPFFHHVVGE